ncbi:MULTISPECIES: hypothetical protein [Thermococcus]|nr:MULTISPECIES: hypothetical protein [Thermococcus]NJE00820.1 hypothetical protein [Thermococcus sp. JdF3]
MGEGMENVEGKMGMDLEWRVRMDKLRAEARANVDGVLKRAFGYLKTSKGWEELEAELYEELSGG